LQCIANRNGLVMRSLADGVRLKFFVLVLAMVLTTVAADAGIAAAPTPANAIDARQAMVAADVQWIAGKTGWKPVSVPRIEARSSRELAAMFFGDAEGYEGVRPLALYARNEHILFLADELALDNLLDQSILLHELVHHMQVSNNIAFDCREEAERQAYQLQAQWLREHGVAQPYAFIGIPEAQIEGLSCP
jgi:hypothetical protein